MKFLFRLFFKLLGTPIFLVWILTLLTFNRLAIIYEWAYEASDYEKRLTWDMHKEFRGYFKQWFSKV